MHPEDQFDDRRFDQRRPPAPQGLDPRGVNASQAAPRGPVGAGDRRPPPPPLRPGSPTGPQHRSGPGPDDATRRAPIQRPVRPSTGPGAHGVDPSVQGGAGRHVPRDETQTRAQPPAVLSGPGATANAAYSMAPGQQYGQDRSGPHPSEAETEIHDQLRLDDHRSDDTHADEQDPSSVTASPRNSTNVLSIVAVVLSFLGITSIFGVICAHVARRRIRETKEQGESLTTAALWIGYFYIAAAVLCLIVYFWIAGQGS